MNQTSENSKKLTYRNNVTKFISKKHFKMVVKRLELDKSHFLRHTVDIYMVVFNVCWHTHFTCTKTWKESGYTMGTTVWFNDGALRPQNYIISRYVCLRPSWALCVFSKIAEIISGSRSGHSCNNLMASLSRLEAPFLDVTSDALNNCSFQNK